MKKVMKHLVVWVLAMAMVFSSAAIVPNATTASAKKTKTVKATKLKMKKKVVKMKVGQKKKLRITVKPKKATITWKSSKKKVATVSKKGVVVAKKAGTTKITATSGKKKAVCKVKVSKAAVKPGIASIAVLDSKTVRVNLTAAKALNVRNFTVRKKSDGSGAYVRTLSVASVNKLNAKSYEVCLSTNDSIDSDDDNNGVYDGDYVQVTVSALTGNKTAQTQYVQSRYALPRYFTGTVGQEIDRSAGFSQSYTGYLTNVKITGVPNGLTARVVGNYVKLKGTLKTAKASVMTLTAKDEKGKSLKQTYNCYVGSDSVMYSYIEAGRRIILANDDNSEWYNIYTVGGSGSYTYSLPNNKNKFVSLDSDNDVQFASCLYNNNKKIYMSAGKYNVAYQVRDTKGHINNGTLAVTAVNGVKVSGRVLAADGAGIENAEVVAYFSDEKNEYYRSYMEEYTYENGETDRFSTAKMKSGDYNIMLYPSQRYRFYAEKNDVRQTIGSKNVGKSAMSINFKLAIYRVTLSCAKDDLSNTSWYDVNGSYLGYGKVLYLKKGNYAIHGVSGFYIYKAAFGVNANRAVALSRSYSENVKGTIAVDGSISCSSGKYLAFTAPETATYTFKATGCSGAYASLSVYDVNDKDSSIGYVSNQQYDSETDESVYSDEITCEIPLTAGKTYMICYSHNNDNSAVISASKKTEEVAQ